MKLHMDIKITDIGDGRLYFTANLFDENGHCVHTLTLTRRRLASGLKSCANFYREIYAEQSKGIASAQAIGWPYENIELPF
jgi:hypothetical protein